ncbi:MAG: serine protease [Gammaproteobacteria bacterium]
MIKDPHVIDRFSAIPFVIKILFNETFLSHATGFIYKYENKDYLITNWHVMSGRHAVNKRPLNDYSALPNVLQIFPTVYDGKTCRRLNSGIKINLRNSDDSSYLWLEHPLYSNEVDVSAIEIPEPQEKLAHVNMVFDRETCYETHIAQDVFILGYPLENYIISGFPIWKRGTIATSPAFNVSGTPKYLIDTATRSGMSGSPVFASFLNTGFRRATGELVRPGKDKLRDSDFSCAFPIFEFIGVYSSRIGDPSVNDTLQLGNVWKASVIEEIIMGNKLYEESFKEAIEGEVID